MVTGRKSGARKTLNPLVYRKESDTNAVPEEVKGYLLPTSLLVGQDHYKFRVVLDDVTTAGKHFAEAFATGDDGKAFVPGEDLVVQAIAYDNTRLTNVGKSETRIVSSLFGSVSTRQGDATGAKLARVQNFRHLENLDKTISDVDLKSGNATNLGIEFAEQLSNLDWNTFHKRIYMIDNNITDEDYRTDATTKAKVDGADSVSVYQKGSMTAATTAGNY